MDSLLPVHGLTDDFYLLFLGENLAEAFPKQPVFISNQDACLAVHNVLRIVDVYK
jgi:hypothetical protein